MSTVKVLLFVITGMGFLIVFILNCIGNNRQNWIKASDKLPHKYEDEIYSDRVLLLGKYPAGHHILIGSYWVNKTDNNSVHWVDDEFGDDVFDVSSIVVTHWMPLPEGPEGEK